MTLTALADAVGISLVNLSIMKNNRARATGYSTLTVICPVLVCQPGGSGSASSHPEPHRCTGHRPCRVWRQNLNGSGAAGGCGRPSWDRAADAPRPPA